MPGNDLQNVADILIDAAAVALRNNAILPLLVNRDMQSEAAEFGKVIQVPIYASMTVGDVTAGSLGTAQDIKPQLVDVKLDQWKEIPFVLSDKEMAEVDVNRVVLPPVMARAVAAMADAVHTYISSKLYRAAWANEAAESSAAVADIIALRKAMNTNNVPKDSDRHLVVSADIGAQLLLLAAFHEADKVGETTAMREGSLGRKFGFNMFEMNSLPSHTEGDFAGTGDATAAFLGFSGGYTDIGVTRTSGTMKPGDAITFAGHAQVYSVLGKVVNGALVESDLTTTGTIRVMPTLKVTLAGTEAITHANATHALGGIAFHRNAMAFATRPLQTTTTPGAIVSQTTDPISGLSLRLTVTYIGHQLRWTLDMLYGGHVVYSEMLARLKD